MSEAVKSRARSGAGVVALAAVVLAPALASWQGLVGFGVHQLGLSAAWAVVVPVSVDGAAMYAAVLAMRAVLHADSALTPRLLTVAYALASAGFNAENALHRGEGLAGAAYFGGAALSAAVLWDVTLRAIRRNQLRALGLLETPLPRFRAVRWLVAPIETAAAWRAAVLEDLATADDALRLVRRARAEQISVRQLAIAELREQTNQSAPAPAGDADRLGELAELADAAQANNDVNGNTEGADQGAEHEEVRHGEGNTGDGGQRRWDAQEAVLAAGDRGRGGAGGVGSERGGHGRQSDLGLAGRGEERDRGVLPRSALPQLSTPRTGLAVPSEQLRKVCTDVQLSKLRKSEAVRAAFDELGERDVPGALALLSGLGVPVDRSYAYQVDWTPTPRATGLQVIAGGER